MWGKENLQPNKTTYSEVSENIAFMKHKQDAIKTQKD